MWFNREAHSKEKCSSYLLTVEWKYILTLSHTYHIRENMATFGMERNIFTRILKVYREYLFERKTQFVSLLYMSSDAF